MRDIIVYLAMFSATIDEYSSFCLGYQLKLGTLDFLTTPPPSLPRLLWITDYWHCPFSVDFDDESGLI